MSDKVKKFIPLILLGVGILILVLVFVVIKNKKSAKKNSLSSPK